MLRVLVIPELGDAPVLVNPRVQEILVDRCKLVLKDPIEVFDDGRIAFHCCSPSSCSIAVAIIKRKASLGEAFW